LSEAVKSFYSPVSVLHNATETRASYAPWVGLTCRGKLPVLADLALAEKLFHFKSIREQQTKVDVDGNSDVTICSVKYLETNCIAHADLSSQQQLYVSGNQLHSHAV
jgi:hypothetical protein